MATKTKSELNTEQIEIVGQMNDLSFENPKLTFEQATKKAGINFKVPNGKAWEKECREVFDASGNSDVLIAAECNTSDRIWMRGSCPNPAYRQVLDLQIILDAVF